LTPERCNAFRKVCGNENETPLANLIDAVADARGAGPYMDFNEFMEVVDKAADDRRIKLTAKRERLIQSSLAQRDQAAPPVIYRTHKQGESDPLHGLYEATIKGKRCILEYEPDTDLRDWEQVPLQESGGIEAFIKREVLPYAKDAWVDKGKTQIGYEISFNRYFYKPQPSRSLDEIKKDILALERETEGLLKEIVEGSV
jgi:type I restriction enzyme M protein